MGVGRWVEDRPGFDEVLEAFDRMYATEEEEGAVLRCFSLTSDL